MKPKAYRSYRHSLRADIKCWICSISTDKQEYIPIGTYALNKNLSVRQVQRLLRKGMLLGFKYKRNYYVMEFPSNG